MRLRWIIKKILGRRKSGLISELSTPAIHRAILRAIEVAAPEGVTGDHLDVGSGVLSTPNALNLRSRLHYLTCGFPNLFGPLAVGERDVHSPRGHINPVGLFYLVHALLEANFIDIGLNVDHYQRRSLFAFFLLYLPIYIAGRYNYRRELKKYRTINSQNDWIVRAINSRDILLGRTLIVTARKAR